MARQIHPVLGRQIVAAFQQFAAVTLQLAAAQRKLGGIALQSLLLGLQLLYHFQNFLDHAVLFSPFRSCRRRIFSNVSRISLRGTILSTKP